MKYTKQLFVHKIGGFVQNQTIPFLIYAFVSLKIVAFYGNYTIIQISWRIQQQFLDVQVQELAI